MTNRGVPILVEKHGFDPFKGSLKLVKKITVSRLFENTIRPSRVKNLRPTQIEKISRLSSQFKERTYSTSK